MRERKSNCCLSCLSYIVYFVAVVQLMEYLQYIGQDGEDEECTCMVFWKRGCGYSALVVTIITLLFIISVQYEIQVGWIFNYFHLTYEVFVVGWSIVGLVFIENIQTDSQCSFKLKISIFFGLFASSFVIFAFLLQYFDFCKKCRRSQHN